MYDAIPSIQKEIDANNEVLNNFDDNLYQLHKKLNLMKLENADLKKKFEQYDDKFKDINIKLQDLSIIDIIKANAGGEGSDMNVYLGIIKNLEKKIKSKNELIDQKIAKIDENTFKVTKEIQNVKNTQDLNKRVFDTIQKKFENLTDKEEEMRKLIDESSNDVELKLESKLKELEVESKISIDKLSNEIKNLSLEKEKNVPQINKEIKKESVEIDKKQMEANFIEVLENSEIIKSIKDTISEVNKKIRGFITQINIEKINLDISVLKSGMNNYALASDVKELKEISDENKTNLKKFKEDFDDFQSYQNENSDTVSLKKKLEALVCKVQVLEENENYLRKNALMNTKSDSDDKNQYLLYKTYEENKAKITKEFNNVNENFVNLRKILDDLIESVKNRVSFKDLKALEDAVMSKLEDLKIASSKKFSDKIEVNRTIKFLDQQIRNIVQVYIKKMEKGENWLMSKKPITSNLCASCESYIGDLQDSNNNNNLYIPWNKFPVKDPNDKLYRMGSGFSKMLQMIQVDENDKKNAFQTYKEMNDLNKNKNNMNKTEYFNSYEDSSDTRTKNKNNLNKTILKNLPKLHQNRLKKKVNTFSDTEKNINANYESEDNDEEPKITKIVKMGKEQS